MTLPQLAVAYIIVGVGCGLALALIRRQRGVGVLGDAALVIFFWPLYGPFLILRAEEAPSPGAHSAFAESLRRAQGTPLAVLLPDAETAARLGERLRVAAAKRAEIDELLRRPEFSEQTARQRLDELRARGDNRSAAVASSRLENVRRLRRLRDRFCRELDEVEELLGQLHIQAEVVRIAGSLDEESRDLVAEIVGRVEGLDAVLSDEEADGRPAVDPLAV